MRVKAGRLDLKPYRRDNAGFPHPEASEARGQDRPVKAVRGPVSDDLPKEDAEVGPTENEAESDSYPDLRMKGGRVVMCSSIIVCRACEGTGLVQRYCSCRTGQELAQEARDWRG